jgi:fumarate reductase subunit D
MRKPVEPLLWSLFGAGGALSALLFPILALILTLAIPLGWVDGPEFAVWRALLQSFTFRLVLTVVITLSLFHWAHRFRFTLYDGLQLQHFDSLISLVCYGGAFALSVYTSILLLTGG